MNQQADIAFSYRLRLLSVLALIAVMGVYVNNLLFMHCHVLPDSTIITHAHPYSADEDTGTPFPAHAHTSTEYLIYSQLHNPAFLLAFTLALALLCRKYVLKLVPPLRRVILKQSVILLSKPHRGPPHLA